MLYARDWIEDMSTMPSVSALRPAERSSLVVGPMADKTIMGGLADWDTWSWTSFVTSLRRAASAREEPPNLQTTRSRGGCLVGLVWDVVRCCC